jgi:hypothetical protein
MYNYAAKNIKKLKQLFLKPPTYVLCKISVVECSYWSVN